MAKDNPTFPKLNRSNHSTWCVCMIMHLTRLGLWGVVSGTETCPPGSATSKSVCDYTAKLTSAWLEMGLRVKDSQLGYFDSLETDPAAVWKKLNNVHKSGGFATIMQLKHELASFHRNPATKTIQDYISCVKEIHRCLKDLGSPPSDQEVISVLLKQPDSYSALLVGLDFIPTEQITIDYIITRLLTEETCQNGVALQSSGWAKSGSSSAAAPNAAFWKHTECNTRKQNGYKSCDLRMRATVGYRNVKYTYLRFADEG